MEHKQHEVLPLTQQGVIHRTTPNNDSLSKYFKEAFSQKMRDKVTYQRFASHIVVATIIGLIYYHVGNEASLVMRNANCIHTVICATLSAWIPSFIKSSFERSRLLRDGLSFKNTMVFYDSFVDITFQIIFSAVFAYIIYGLTSQPLEFKRIHMFSCICVLTSLISQDLGLLIGIGLNKIGGLIVGISSTIFLILFSGFVFNSETPVYLQWPKYISFTHYGFEGAILSIYGMDREAITCSEAYCHFRHPIKILKVMSMNSAEYWIDFLALIGIFIVLRTTNYLVLRWRFPSKG
ncbi:ABCG4 family protein [Megaselia abdita]